MKIKTNHITYTKEINIKIILKQADLMGLIKIGAPDDEYDHEAKYLCKVITNMSTVGFIQKALWNVFYNSFGYDFKTFTVAKANKFIGPISKYKLPAQQIHDILKNDAS